MLLRFETGKSKKQTPITMTIDWVAFLDGQPSIQFNRKPKYYFGIVLHHLWQYNDAQDEANFENATDLIAYPTRNFVWERQDFQVTDEAAEVRVNARYQVPSSSENNKGMANKRHLISSGTKSPFGSVSLTFSTHGTAGHSEKIPHLLHTENSTEIDLILKDLRIQPNVSCTRLALGVTAVSMADPKGNFSLNTRRSVDDEFTPGIFDLINLSSKGGFVQYRPVSYTNEARDVSTSTLVRQTDPQHVDDVLSTLSETVFMAATKTEGVGLRESLVQNLNISFGVGGDGCFEKTNYTTWTLISAYGQPLPEKLSTLVVVIAALGLGIPLILMISGGCFVCLRKARQ